MQYRSAQYRSARTVAVALALLLAWPLSLAAETVITRYDHPLDLQAPRQEEQPNGDRNGEEENGLFSGTTTKATVATEGWVIPNLKVDQNNANGETTLFSIRHEGEVMALPGIVTVFFRDIFRNDIGTVQYALAPNQVQTVNPRVAANLPADLDGVTRGFVEIAGDFPFSVDYFQIDGINNAASGDNAAGFPDDFCENWKIRFLNGGPFNGGTEVLMLINGPMGDDPMNPPTVAGNVYREDGSFVNSFEIRTNEWMVVRDSAELVNPGNSFGAMELRIDAVGNDTGFIYTRQSASGRYSVALNGVCKDDQFIEE